MELHTEYVHWPAFDCSAMVLVLEGEENSALLSYSGIVWGHFASLSHICCTWTAVQNGPVPSPVTLHNQCIGLSSVRTSTISKLTDLGAPPSLTLGHKRVTASIDSKLNSVGLK